MSDEEFELEKEIANVHQLKSFGKFMNNYVNKKEHPEMGNSFVESKVPNKSTLDPKSQQEAGCNKEERVVPPSESGER